jgi:cytoskeletal protein RodZ
MTKSTLNALLAGGGLLATWLAVNPNTTATRPRSSVAATTSTSAAREVSVDDLNLQEARLREHLGSAPLRPSARNPFRFGKAAASATPAHTAAAPAVAPTPSPAAQPPLSLSGIATDKGKRTAIISGEGQLYLVTEGERVAGRYQVVSVDSDTVTLRDDTGGETRLFLH